MLEVRRVPLEALAETCLYLGRLEECRTCRAELHVCKMCEWYSLSVAKQCRETVAEEVKDKERANFCDYFKPRPGAHVPANVAGSSKARSDLDALFGGTKNAGSEPTAADRAKAELDKLFKK